MKDTAFRIKELRENINLSIPKMAAKLAVESYVVRDTELRKQRVSQDLILKYAEYFDVTLDWLMTGEGEKYAKTDAVKEPVASYGGGVLESILKSNEELKKNMLLLLDENRKISKRLEEIERFRNQEAA
jgi:transcriptional regulator with XRE-family HTH domain